MECCGRPNRSDAHLSKEEATKIEGETKEYFDGLAPKRHAKPQRSEYSSQYIDAVSNDHDNGVIPEYLEFQHLQKDSKKLVYNGSEVPEEFVETEYYKDLTSIDKQHHTTGTGFIKTGNTNNVPFSLDSDSTTDLHASCKGNPPPMTGFRLLGIWQISSLTSRVGVITKMVGVSRFSCHKPWTRGCKMI